MFIVVSWDSCWNSWSISVIHEEQRNQAEPTCPQTQREQLLSSRASFIQWVVYICLLYLTIPTHWLDINFIIILSDHFWLIFFNHIIMFLWLIHVDIPGGVASSPPPYPGPSGAAPSMHQPQPYPTAGGYPAGSATNHPPPSSMQFSYPSAPPYPI